MDITNKIHAKLTKILKKLKGLGIIQTFILEMNFCQVENSVKKSLIDIDLALKRCLRKIIIKPREAEIRNIISELVRKKNLNNVLCVDESVRNNLLVTKFKGSNEFVALPLNFPCNLCGKIFSSEKNLIIHKNKHEKTAEYLCEKCGKLFYNIKNWLEHQTEFKKHSAVHVKMKSLTSDNKSELIINKTDDLEVLPEALIKNKIISESLKQNPVAKESKTSFEKNNLQSQVPNKLEGKFICDCGKVFQVLKTLRRHERIKHSIKNVQYQCITCGKCFKEKGKLNRHMLSHNGYQYSCSFCSKQFFRSDTLKRHISLFHFPPKMFFCSFCQKKFNLKYNRDIHEENIHKNVDNCVQCDYCGNKFRNKITLKNHFKTHFENKITCTACKKSFNRKSYFEIHMKNKHIGAVPDELNSVIS